MVARRIVSAVTPVSVAPPDPWHCPAPAACPPFWVLVPPLPLPGPEPPACVPPVMFPAPGPAAPFPVPGPVVDPGMEGPVPPVVVGPVPVVVPVPWAAWMAKLRCWSVRRAPHDVTASTMTATSAATLTLILDGPWSDPPSRLGLLFPSCSCGNALPAHLGPRPALLRVRIARKAQD